MSDQGNNNKKNIASARADQPVRSQGGAADNPNRRHSIYLANIIFLSFLTLVSLLFAMSLLFRPWIGGKSIGKRFYSASQIEEIEDAAAKEERAALLSQLQSSFESGESALVVLRKTYEDRIVAMMDGAYCFLPVSEEVEKNPFSPGKLLVREDEVIFTGEASGVEVEKGVYLSDDNGRVDWDRVSRVVNEVRIRAGALTGRGFLVDEQADRNCRKADEKGVRAQLCIELDQPVLEETLGEGARYVFSLAEKYGLFSGEEPADVLVRIRTQKDGGGSAVEEWTQAAGRLCELIREGGAEPVLGMSFYTCGAQIDTGSLSQYGRWIIDDADELVFPYSFRYWEYGGRGHVEGVPGICPSYVRISAE